MDFAKIAPYLQDPLVLIGFVLVLFFGLGRTIVKAGIIPVLEQGHGFRILQNILLYGFILALSITALGFGLKYRELSRHEQKAAVDLLNRELLGDIAVSAELQQNTITILGAAGTVAKILRHPGIRLLPAFFPEHNLTSDSGLPASLDLARQRLARAEADGLLADPENISKLRQAAAAISGTIARTQATIASLSDSDHERYIISDSVWNANLPILRRIDIIDTSQMEELYQEMHRLRTDYGVVIANCLNYLLAIQKYFSDPDKLLDPQSLAEIL